MVTLVSCLLHMLFQYQVSCKGVDQYWLLILATLVGPYKGSLLSAIAYDADDGMFPITLGVVSSENYED